MIMQLGPPSFFMTFTIGVNNWSIFIKTLKDLYEQYIGENLKIKKDDSLSIVKLVKNDHVTCACYYEHRMNSFCKLIQNTNLIFGKVKGCRNLSLGFVTKARGCKVAGQEKDSRVTSHALGNAKECEGMNLHTLK
jgi:hypothetical protein